MSLGKSGFQLPITSLVAIGLLAGCLGCEAGNVDPKQDIKGITKIAVSINRDIDILFVIDNSGSMAEEQSPGAAPSQRFATRIYPMRSS